MELLLQREPSSAHATLGKLYVDGVFECDTLEDVVRAVKIQNETAISAGRYRVIITFSAHFKRMLPLLLNVLNYLGVRIHSGNTDKDTEGCILTGIRVNDDFVGHSRDEFDRLFAKMEAAIAAGQEIWLTVKDAA